MNQADYKLILMGLGQVLTKARHDLGLTQGELASKMGKVQSAVAKIERAPSENIALRIIYELATLLEMPLSEVFARAENLAGFQQKDLHLPKKKPALDVNHVDEVISNAFERAHQDILRQLTRFDT